MMETHEYAIMKALLKRIYYKNMISSEAYSQTAYQIDSLLDKAPTPSYTTENRKGANQKYGIVSNPGAAADRY